MRAVDEPETVDPAEGTLKQFNLIFGNGRLKLTPGE